VAQGAADEMVLHRDKLEAVLAAALKVQERPGVTSRKVTKVDIYMALLTYRAVLHLGFF